MNTPFEVLLPAPYYFAFCNILHIWACPARPSLYTYRVYRFYDYKVLPVCFCQDIGNLFSTSNIIAHSCSIHLLCMLHVLSIIDFTTLLLLVLHLSSRNTLLKLILSSTASSSSLLICTIFRCLEGGSVVYPLTLIGIPVCWTCPKGDHV